MKHITHVTFEVERPGRPANCKPVTYTISTASFKLAKQAAILMLQQEHSLSKYYNIATPVCVKAELHEA